MQHLEVSGAVRHIYIIRRLKVKWQIAIPIVLYQPVHKKGKEETLRHSANDGLHHEESSQ